MTPVTDPGLLAQLNGSSDPKPVTDPAILAQLNGGQSSGVMDFFKSIPRGVAEGIGSVVSLGSRAMDPNMALVMGANGMDPYEIQQQTGAVADKAVSDTINTAQEKTGAFPEPQGPAGKFGKAVGGGLGNPLTYALPGSLPFKVGGSILSSLGGEGGRQAAEGTPYEIPAQIGGNLVGGIAGVKTLGPKAVAAEIPASRAAWKAGPNGEKIVTGEPGLKEIAGKQYNEARAANVELDPVQVANRAKVIEHKVGPGFDADTAPTTIKTLRQLQTPEAGEFPTLVNIDNARKKLNEVAKLTDNTGKPTSDAAAAQIVKRHLGDYLEGDALNHVVVRDPKQAAKLVTEFLQDQPQIAQRVIAQANAGDTTALSQILKNAGQANATKAINTYKTANQNWAAYRRARSIEEAKLLGEDQAGRQTAGSEARRIRLNLGRIQDRITKSDTTLGYSAKELAGIKRVSNGPIVSKTFDQLGRGHGALPLMLHGMTAVSTGGSLLPLQAAIEAGAYGSKRIAEALTRRQINKLSETMRKRSPEYAARAARVKPHDNSPNQAALIRALLAH